jgi:hypothetical protein
MAVTASAPTLIRESVPGYGVRLWSRQQLDEIAERIPHLHRPAPAGATLTGPTCLFDGRTWPCPCERWRRRHDRAVHVSVKLIRRRVVALGACLTLGLQLLVADSGPASIQSAGMDRLPASLNNERVLIDKAETQAELRGARARHIRLSDPAFSTARTKAPRVVTSSSTPDTAANTSSQERAR